MADDERPQEGAANPPSPQSPIVVVQDDRNEDSPTETISQPAKVLRIGSMTKELLEEVRRASLDDASRSRMKEIFETSVRELAQGISPDLRDELSRITLPFDSDTPTESELRVAQAQLVGWLEGLFHGIQAAIFSQQQQLAMAQMQQGRRGLPVGPPGPGQPGQAGQPAPDMSRPGNYL